MPTGGGAATAPRGSRTAADTPALPDTLGRRLTALAGQEGPGRPRG